MTAKGCLLFVQRDLSIVPSALPMTRHEDLETRGREGTAHWLVGDETLEASTGLGLQAARQGCFPRHARLRRDLQSVPPCVATELKAGAGQELMTSTVSII